MIREAISRVVLKEDLSEEEAVEVMDEIMAGQATPAQIASFITALRMKGETIKEITGLARVMRQKAVKIKTDGRIIVDTCGTGGDGAYTFNISTAAAFVVAGAGIKVAKHGNRSVSSKCGSADVLMELGVNLEIPPEKIEGCLREIGIAFLFAPLLHEAMKYAIEPRREIGIRTVFNILGPLTNPADASCQVLGVYDAQLTEPLAKVLRNLGSHHALVVHGMDGLDEITLTQETQVSELVDNEVKTYFLKPEDFGFTRCQSEDLRGGECGENARILLDVLEGKPGPCRDVVLLNAAAGLVVAGAEDFNAGIELAEEAIESGLAKEKLESLRRYTTQM
ncbi:TPA: anthranilate phosphoribosyltransferase [bacterium]|nr:anthranilate phosphoribosyltransferase [bacterium]